MIAGISCDLILDTLGGLGITLMNFRSIDQKMFFEGPARDTPSLDTGLAEGMASFLPVTNSRLMTWDQRTAD